MDGTTALRAVQVLAVAVAVNAVAPNATAAYLRLIHEFAGGNDGGAPLGHTLGGETLFVTTSASQVRPGALFKVGVDGTGFELLHRFDVARDSGFPPTVVGSTLFGVTTGTIGYGGDELGILYKINSDGAGFEVLRDFAGGVNDGQSPFASLVLGGSTLYGVTYHGGGHGHRGTVFKVNVDGAGFELLHEFAGGADDGANPQTELTLSGSTLYGTTRSGGDRGQGTLFRMEVDGTDFDLLHEFSDEATGIGAGASSLALSGSTLYGTTFAGGNNGLGTVFKIDTDGTDFEVLHHFAGGASDGGGPSGGLTLSGSTLYGTTYHGSGPGIYDVNVGTVFKIETDGTDYEIIYEFRRVDGSNPTGPLTISRSTLIGTTLGGGANNAGTIFALDLTIPEPTTFVLAMFVLTLLITARPLRLFLATIPKWKHLFPFRTQ